MYDVSPLLVLGDRVAFVVDDSVVAVLVLRTAQIRQILLCRLLHPVRRLAVVGRRRRGIVVYTSQVPCQNGRSTS